MKSGQRALGVAASDGDARSTLCGAVVRADRVVDDLIFDTCTIGGTDATDAIITLFRTLDREDVRYVLLAGIAPAWFNVIDLTAVYEAVERPVLSISFEESGGLEPALHEHFDGDALDSRLGVYRALPPRRRVDVNDETVFVRALGVDDATTVEIVRAFTPEGGRPEPVRVARVGARAGREWVESMDRPTENRTTTDD